MTIVSNDPSWWPIINFNLALSYLMVAAGVVVVYNWALNIGQEIELIWRQRWSLMTALYLLTRYIGILYYVTYVLQNMPSFSLGDVGCTIACYAVNGTNVVVGAMMGVIMIARLHAMYQGSRKMLLFLVIMFLAVTIASWILAAIAIKDVRIEELILSSTYMCNGVYDVDVQLFASMTWTLSTIWEVLALCLSAWVAVTHFRDLRRLGQSAGTNIGDCFTVLIQSHVLYFASFVCVSCLGLVGFSPEISNSYSTGVLALKGVNQILSALQMFVLGPRLILSVREYHAKFVANSDAETSMNLIVFQEHVHVTASSTV